MALPAGPAPKPTLPRQSSIYSLTLDEFQNILGEPGKSFGSMNMDEFLKNIWTAEESQAMAAAMGSMAAIDRQQSLSRQGSITLPRTISRKTVDEVWKEIHKDTDATAMDSSIMEEATRQATFGEITLEDFLVKAGVAREDIDPGGPQAQQQGFAPFGSCLDVGFDDTRASAAACTVAEEKASASASALPTLSLSPATAGNAFTAQVAAMDPGAFKHAIPTHFRSPNTPQSVSTHQQQQGTDAAAIYANLTTPICNGALHGSVIGPPETVNGGPPPGGPFGPCFGVGFGTGFAQTALAYGAASPSSPASDAVGPNDISSLSPVPFGLHPHFRGRKRGFEGPLEKIVERRQRRMIKNRESAARSRARKQAYTVELEAEVTQLKQENMLLRRQQEEMVQKKMQVFDMMAPLAQHLSSNIRVLRRTCTVPW